jgi:hypothetical protein
MPKHVGQIWNSISYILESWIKDFFNKNCKKLHNKEVCYLLDSFSKLEVWNFFKSKFPNFDQYANVTKRYWCKIWNKYFPFIKIPKVNQFGVYADCEEFKTIREKAVTIEEKSKKLKINFLHYLCLFFYFYFNLCEY